MGPILFILFIFLIIGSIFWSSHLAAQRRAAMAEVAASLGLSFSSEKNWSYDEQYPFIRKLCQGNRRYGFNVLEGQYRGHSVLLFDYHYQTTSTDSKGRRKTHHHYFSFFILHFAASFPELLICREGWFSKVTQFLGFDDIDFESAEFSNMFLVKSPDKKFAYDICHGQMIEFLLQNRDLNIEIERNCLTLFFGNRLSPNSIPHHIDRLVAIREMFPQYLMDQH